MELAIIGFLFGCFVGVQSYKMYMDYFIRKLLKALKSSGTTLDIQVKEKPELMLFTEVNNNDIMLYKKETNEFVSQAPTLEELANNLFTFNKINFASVNHNKETLWFVEGKIKRDLNS